MLGILRKFWLINPALLGLVLLMPAPGMAEDVVTESTETAPVNQVESVVTAGVDAPQLVDAEAGVALQDVALAPEPQALAPVQTAQGEETQLLAQAEQLAAPAPTTLLAQRQIPPGQDPVTSVDELSDLEPGIWYYDAIVNLVNKYQCVAGVSRRHLQTASQYFSGRDGRLVEQLHRSRGHQPGRY